MNTEEAMANGWKQKILYRLKAENIAISMIIRYRVSISIFKSTGPMYTESPNKPKQKTPSKSHE